MTNLNNFAVTPKTIKYLETGRGVAFTADLTLEGKKIGIIENYGCGGETMSRFNESGFKLNMPLLKETWESQKDVFSSEEDFLNHLMDVAEGVVK